MLKERMNKKILITGLAIALIVIIILIVRPFSSSIGTIDVNEEAIQQLNDPSYYESLIDGIRSGGPPKDGIPSIDKPEFESVEKADEWLVPEDVVFGVVEDDEIFAVPQRILVWHEVMNLEIGGEPRTVTYCPLTGTAIGYKSPSPDANNSSIGVSGKLVNSNLIMYDRATDSYWPQILGQAILGEETGEYLKEFPVIWTTWEKWKKKHPETKVVSRSTGFVRNYNTGGDPYGSYLDKDGYYFSKSIIFGPINESDELGPKKVVIGIRDTDRNAVAIVKDTLRKEKEIEVLLGDITVVVTYDEELDFYRAENKETGEWINAFDSMWFPWYGYFPNTQLVK